MNFRDQLDKLMNEYAISREQEDFAKHSIGTLVRSDIVETLSAKSIDPQKYKVQGSVGQGNWAKIPWICIFNISIADSAQKGVHIVYLLSLDGKRLYLTLNQGNTELVKTRGRAEAIKEMRKTADEIVSRIDCSSFESVEKISLGENLPSTSQLYEEGTICFRQYDRGQLPEEQELFDDLRDIMNIYDQYEALFHGQSMPSNMERQKSAMSERADDNYNNREIIAYIKQFISAKGFSYDHNLVENFYLSLKSKPFVILAGTSGTGKTRLVKLFAEAIGANTANGRFKLVPVRPDWSDSSDLFGHVDLNGNFVPGALIDYLHTASNDIENPYILCLDEMNLARVEYYLSDFLSVMETRDFNQGYIESDPLLPLSYFGTDEKAKAKYGNLRFTQNIYIVGTVNMDETTFPFSRKVLDRANTIEFSYVNMMPDDLFLYDEEIEALDLNNDFLVTEYLRLAHCKDEIELVQELATELVQLNEALQTVGFQIGYRVRDEISFYMINNKNIGLLPQEVAMDHQIIQKTLPRIQGSSLSIKEMLAELFKFCAGDYQGYQTRNEMVSDQMFEYVNHNNCRYPKSAEKIAFMMRRFEEDGFTSYWI